MTLRWGILGPGRISFKFSHDLLESSQIGHQVTAIASNSNIANAESLASKLNSSAQCFGSYDALIESDACDVVYVGTPNFNHFELAQKILNNGKHMLMEKPFMLNTKQTEIVLKLAEQKGLFVMEAMWTKFNPVFLKTKEFLPRIGKVTRVKSDLSYYFPQGVAGFERIYERALGGGALLDIGIYALTWPLALFGVPEEVVARGVLTDTEVDIADSVLLTYPSFVAYATCSGLSNLVPPAIIIEGTDGYIEVDQPDLPKKAVLKDWDHNVLEEFAFDPVGFGMYFEADHVFECIQAGKTQSETHTWKDTLVMSQTLDSIRKQVGVVFDVDSTES